MTYSLFEALPALEARLPRVALGDYPTAVARLAGLPPDAPEVYLKREDASAPGYGGNKIRPLELVFADAAARGATRIWSTGALGSNHALAAAVHAPRAGLAPGALLFGQPSTVTARDNLRALVSLGCELRALRHLVQLPAAAGWRVAASRLGDGREAVMTPGAAVPLGALGHLSAGLEVALQVRAGALPEPRHVVVPVGSTCTSAGLLAAFELARHLGVAFAEGVPTLHAVRITPWPVTSAWRIAGLAARTGALLAELGGPDLGLTRARLGAALSVEGGYLGRGYGHPTRAGLAATHRFALLGAPPLDTTYSAKAAAFLLDLLPRARGPILFWHTKSSAPLPPDDPDAVAAAPAWVRRWLDPQRG